MNKPGSHPHLSRRLGRDDDALHRMRRLQEKSPQNPDHYAPGRKGPVLHVQPDAGLHGGAPLETSDSFSPYLIIGHGSFGSVYKARLPYRGLSAAVKKLSPDAFQGFREFRAEMEILSKLRHPNIVTILGFCSTGSDRVLVYEYIENGSLDQWLPLGTPSETPKSRLSSCRRDEGYMPPEYMQGATVAIAMGDVYSFGILMLQISTGIRPDTMFKEESNGEGVRFVEWAKEKFDELYVKPELIAEFLSGSRSLRCPPRKNRGEIPISQPPAATGLSSTFNPKQVSMADLLKATNNFSPDLIIGHGSFGSVYKARLPHAGLSTVAIKKLSPDAFQGFHEFRAEMEILSKLRHPNIVTILGFCSTGSDRVLVYEYIKNGSLDQWLPLGTPSETPRSWLPSCWKSRIKIAETPRSSRLPLS
ncbi:hypothetical protein RHSIM_Rhsim09G0034100 [Rhododendron simsii]|uniref:Protein kinase domain-containing protein n=1 Tax=Rhododendron simsii TaxID=118357 RepID=A0A834GFW8_RHOSS|nr:hypothetical protein RHSIM_Rhsim09G0034100 [Rhododendron simsii]